MDQEQYKTSGDECPVEWADVYGRIGDESIIAEFAVSFLKNSQTLVLSLKSSIKANCLDRIELYAHALKGSASNIGAICLAKKAWLIEKAASEMSLDNMSEMLEVVETEYFHLKSLLESTDWIERAKRAAEAKV